MLKKRTSPNHVDEIDGLSIIPIDFKDQGEIPLQFYYENENLIPRFTIHNIPPQAKSLALVVEDLETPGKNHTYWIVYNIRVEETEIGGSLELGTTGKNSWTIKEYQGVNPIQGRHHIKFTLYALDKLVKMLPKYKSRELQNEIVNSSIASASVIGYCEKLGSFALE